MRCAKVGIAGAVLAGAVTLSLRAGEAMAIEEPNYTEIEQAEDY
ncbi:MAG: hypothetical protein WBN48_21635 [Thiogranum sp.]